MSCFDFANFFKRDLSMLIFLSAIPLDFGYRGKEVVWVTPGVHTFPTQASAVKFAAVVLEVSRR